MGKGGLELGGSVHLILLMMQEMGKSERKNKVCKVYEGFLY